MNSNKEKSILKRKSKLDKQSSATIVLAFTMICFLFTMFMASNQIGASYAVPTSSNEPPATLTYSGTIGSKNWNYMSDLTINYDFKTTDGTKTYDMYCIEGQEILSVDNNVKTTIYNNPTAISSAVAPGLAYILDKAYPNDSDAFSSCGTDNDCKKYLSQYAVWLYLDDMGYKDSKKRTQLTAEQTDIFNNLVTNGDIFATDVKKLVTSAKNYNSNKQAVPTVNIDKNSIKYSVSSDGSYIESSEIAVSSENYPNSVESYVVNLTANNCNAEVVDVNGNPAQSFGAGTTFKVRIPTKDVSDLSNIDLEVSVDTAFLTDTVYEYTSSDGDQKPIINTYTKTYTSSNLKVKLGLVQIIKTDITNGNRVEGAVLKVTDSNGNEVASWTTTKDPYYINLMPGSYTLTEVTAPEGYELSTETIPFTVSEDGSIIRLEMRNTPTTPVPNTAENIPMYLYIIGAMILVIGAGVIYVTAKPKKNK